MKRYQISLIIALAVAGASSALLGAWPTSATAQPVSNPCQPLVVSEEPGKTPESLTTPSPTQSSSPDLFPLAVADDVSTVPGEKVASAKLAPGRPIQPNALPGPVVVNSNTFSTAEHKVVDRPADPHADCAYRGAGLTYRVGFQYILFSWPPATDIATASYRLQVSSGSEATYVSVPGAENLRELSFRIRIRYWDVSWSDTRYRLQVCTAANNCLTRFVVALSVDDERLAVLRFSMPWHKPLQIDPRLIDSGDRFIYNEGHAGEGGEIRENADENRIGSHDGGGSRGNGDRDSDERTSTSDVTNDGKDANGTSPSSGRSASVAAGGKFSETGEDGLVRPCSITRADRSAELVIQKSCTTSAYARSITIVLSGDGLTYVNEMPWHPVNLPEQYQTAAQFTGAVFVYSFQNGQWIKQATLHSPKPEWGDYFGASSTLSADGNTLAVSAPGKDISLIGEHSTPSNRDLIDPGATVGQVDEGISLSGVRLAPDDRMAYGSGTVYIFRRTDGQWRQTASLTAPTPRTNDYLGGPFSFQLLRPGNFGDPLSLSADGNILAIGASFSNGVETYDFIKRHVNNPAQLDEDPRYSGLVYVFEYGAGGWSLQDTLTAADGAPGDFFGSAVSLSADASILVVGAPGKDITYTVSGQGSEQKRIAKDAGGVYVFERTDGAWNQKKTLIRSQAPSSKGYFGSTVVVSADGSTIGARPTVEDSINPDDVFSYRTLYIY